MIDGPAAGEPTRMMLWGDLRLTGATPAEPREELRLHEDRARRVAMTEGATV